MTVEEIVLSKMSSPSCEEYVRLGGDVDKLSKCIRAYAIYRKVWSEDKDFTKEQEDYLCSVKDIEPSLRCLVRTICEE